MMGIDIIVILGGFIGACAYFSYKSGMKDGYQEMANEVATAIVDIHMEQQKIEVMKLEVQQIQRECLQLMEENQT
jgi:hypothetical protein